MDIGTAFKKIREKKGLTQEKAAELIGIRQSALSRLERPGSKPEMGTMENVAKGYDIPMEVILFMSLDASDIPEKRRDFYSALAPHVQAIIDEAILTK